MLFFTYIDKNWPVTLSLRRQLLACLKDALRRERQSIESHSGGYQLLIYSIARIPGEIHPEMTIRVYVAYFHFLGALHADPLVPGSANYMPDDAYHRATRVLKLVLKGEIPDRQVYFNLGTQRSLNTIMVI